MTSLIGATRRLAGGDLAARVQPDGPAELRELATAFNAMADDLEVAHGARRGRAPAPGDRDRVASATR